MVSKKGPSRDDWEGPLFFHIPHEDRKLRMRREEWFRPASYLPVKFAFCLFKNAFVPSRKSLVAAIRPKQSAPN